MSQLTTAGGREFQVAGAAQLKDRLPISVRLNGTSRNGTADDRSDRVPLHALMKFIATIYAVLATETVGHCRRTLWGEGHSVTGWGTGGSV